MKKFIAKIVGIATAFAMVIGVGVAVANNRNVLKLKADGGTLSISDYASDNSWVDKSAYTTVEFDSHVTFTGRDNGNNSKYYSSNNSWRHYEGDSGTITINVTSGYVLNSVSFAFSSGNNGCLTYNENNYATGASINLSSLTIATIGVGHSSGTKNGNVQITSITVSYSSSSGSSSSSAPSSSSSSEAPSTFTVAYNSNGATSGDVPVDNTAYSNGASVTVLGNTGSLAKTGYVWGGWNTAADGTGVSYAAGETFNISANTTLYARWITDYSTAENVIITADYLNLNSTGFTSATILTADDKIQYSAAPNGDKTSVKATPINGSSTNKFNSDSPILMGKQGAYLYNNDSFRRNIARIEVFINYGAAAAAEVAIDFGATRCTSSYTDDAQPLNPANAVYTFTPEIANAQFFRVQVTQNANVQIQLKVVFAIPTESVTVTPESVTLNPTNQQQLTTTVLPANRTDSLVYSSSAPAIATVSNNGLITAVTVGTATITATSGSCSDTCVVTVELPADPFITPVKTETSGYTEQFEVISFTYGNLTGSLGVATSNAKVSASIQNDDGVNTAEVKINFVSAGSSAVYLKDGDTTRATITIASITESAVTIEGLPSSHPLCPGETLDLGSMITVNETGACSADVFWESDDTDVAEVDLNGVVTGKAVGTANITVTPLDDMDAAETCVITVAESNFVRVNKFQNGKKYIIAAQGATDPNQLFYLPAATSEIAKNPAAVEIKTFGALTEANSWTASVDASGHIVFSHVVDETTYYLTAVNDAQGIKVVLDPGEGYWTLDGTGLTYSDDGSRYLSTYNDSSFRYYSSSTTLATVFYKYNPAGSAVKAINNTDTRATLSYNYTKNGENDYTFTNLKVRLGGFLSKALWEDLDAESDIEGYGIMLSYGDLDGNSIKYWYNYARESMSIDDAIDALYDPLDPNDGLITEGRNCYAGLTNEKKNPAPVIKDAQDYYLWNLCLDDLTTDADFKKEFTVVAYIRTEAEIVFFDEVTVSVKSLAQDLIDGPTYNASSFDGSLSYLANLA